MAILHCSGIWRFVGLKQEYLQDRLSVCPSLGIFGSEVRHSRALYGMHTTPHHIKQNHSHTTPHETKSLSHTTSHQGINQRTLKLPHAVVLWVLHVATERGGILMLMVSRLSVGLHKERAGKWGHLWGPSP